MDDNNFIVTPEELIQNAYLAQKRAKSSYSEYPVGAALLCKDDTIILGCNIESKAYPTTLCAERVAIFSALSLGHKTFKAMAVVTNDGAMPCGACRQIIHEFAGNISILISNSEKEILKTSIKELLPQPFG